MTRTVLVTGSSRGIGKAIVEKLASDGFQPVIHCRSNVQDAQAVAESLGLDETPRVLQFDIADRDTTQAVITEDIKTHGAYYGVICNAGITRDAAFPMLKDDDWDSVIHTNLDGFYNIMKPAVMPMVRNKQGGRILTIASVSGIMGNRGQVNYSASKAGLIGATKALSLELAKRKITVNCVAPGLIETDMTDDLPSDVIEQIIPLRRAGQASEVAAAVSFLMSDGAAYITRQVLSVNGGMC